MHGTLSIVSRPYQRTTVPSRLKGDGEGAAIIVLGVIGVFRLFLHHRSSYLKVIGSSALRSLVSKIDEVVYPVPYWRNERAKS